MSTDLDYLRAAIVEAQTAEAAGEVPVGAVVVHQGKIIGRGQNRVLRDSDPSAHAEVVALREAGQHLANYRIEDCILYVTLEPCAMCAGAILHARIRRLVYAALDPKAGACGSVLAVMNHPQLNHRVEVHQGLLSEECGALLTNFFRQRRKAKAAARILQNGEAPMATTKKWSAKVHTESTHPQEGLFNKSATEIAKALASKKVSPKGPASGMRMLNFYINRAGKNLSKDRLSELEKAKTKLSDIIAKQKKESPSKTAAKSTRKTAKKTPSARKAAKKKSSRKTKSTPKK
ncbi:MAG TPA: tRNA adenosine(34) deaminase TadA [Edaphobacter sp.]|nr:tRNA adenosine(34) deaminase TadA [Edaphobacter sp.]